MVGLPIADIVPSMGCHLPREVGRKEYKLTHASLQMRTKSTVHVNGEL